MFDVDTYLSRLDLAGPPAPTLPNLRRLQKRHLTRIPFDSALYAEQGMAVLRNARIDLDTTFDEVVVGGRGGTCYDLNGLFRELLSRLGYEVFILAAAMPGPDGFGLDIEHMFNGVRLDGETWLVDVGYPGPGYIEPIRFSDEVQHQYGSRFRLVEQDGFHVVQRSGRDGKWAPVYRLHLRERSVQEWLAVADLAEEDGWNWEGEEVAAGTVIRGRTFETGQAVLIGRRLTVVDDGVTTVRTLADPAAYRRTLDELLGPEVPTGEGWR